MGTEKKWLFRLGLVVVVLAIGYTAWWWQAASGLRSAIDGWIAVERGRGSTVRIGALAIGGFPFTLRAEATDILVRRADGLEWHGPGLVAQARPWRLTDIALTMPGAHRLRLPPAGGVPAEGGFHDGAGQLGLTLTGVATDARLSLKDLTFGPGFAASTVIVTASRPPEPPADVNADGLTLSVTAQGMVLPETLAQGLSRSAEGATLAARVKGAPPAALSRPALETWRQAGGTVELDKLSLAWGPLILNTTGTLALDKEMQPEGALVAEITGYGPVIEALVAAGQIRRKDADTARMVLSLLARPKEAGGQPVLSAPVTIQHQALFLGPLRVADMPVVRWE